MLRSISLPFLRRNRNREDGLEEYNSVTKMFSNLKTSIFNRETNNERYTDVDRTELCPEDSFYRLDIELGVPVSLKPPLVGPEIAETIDTSVEDFGYISFNRTFVIYGVEQKYLKVLPETDCPDRYLVRNIELPSGSWLKPVYGYVEKSEYFAGINHIEKDSTHYHVSVYLNFLNNSTTELKVREAGKLSNLIEHVKYGRLDSAEHEKVAKKIEDYRQQPNEVRLFAALEYDSPIVCLANCPINASLAFCNDKNNCFVFEPKFLNLNHRRYMDYYLKTVINLSMPTTGLQICHRFLAVKNNDSTSVFKFLSRESSHSSSTNRAGRRRLDKKTNYALIFQRVFKLSQMYEKRIELRLQRPEQQAQFEKIILRPIRDTQNKTKAVVLFIWRHEEITCVLFPVAHLHFFPISRILVPAEREILDVDIALDKDMIHLLTSNGLLTYYTYVHEFVKLYFESDRNNNLLNLFYSKTSPFKRMYLISMDLWQEPFNFVKIVSSSSYLRFLDRNGKIHELIKPGLTEIEVYLSMKHAEFSYKSRLMRRFFYRRATEPAYAGIPTTHPMIDMSLEDLLPGGKLPESNWLPSNLWTCHYDPTLDERHLTLADGIMLTSDQLSLKKRKKILLNYQYFLNYFQDHFQA